MITRHGEQNELVLNNTCRLFLFALSSSSFSFPTSSTFLSLRNYSPTTYPIYLNFVASFLFTGRLEGEVGELGFQIGLDGQNALPNLNSTGIESPIVLSIIEICDANFLFRVKGVLFLNDVPDAGVVNAVVQLPVAGVQGRGILEITTARRLRIREAKILKVADLLGVLEVPNAVLGQLLEIALAAITTFQEARPVVKLILVIEAEEGDLGRVSRRYIPLEVRGSLKHVIHAGDIAAFASLAQLTTFLNYFIDCERKHQQQGTCMLESIK